MPVKVFITDDHYMVIEGIHSLLQHENDIELMGHATNGASCMAFLQQHTPDVILLDINLPDISGIDLCRDIKQKYPHIFVIGLSTFNQQSIIEKMLENGASGYVLKNAGRDELMDAILKVTKGQRYLSFEASQALKKTKEAQIIITRREKEVLELIADGLTNNEIAAKLFISISTAESHRKNLLWKLNAKNTAELVKLAVWNKLISITG